MNGWWAIAIFTFGVTVGTYCDSRFHVADQVDSAYRQVAKAQKGEMEIIKDQQKLEANHAKHKDDPCDNALVPADDTRVLH